MGEDACIILTGGDRPHLGAVAVGQPRPSLADPEKVSVTLSNITLLGHKDDILARRVAVGVTPKLAVNVVVCCGVHLDNILPEEITDILDLTDEMIEEIIKLA